VAFEDTIVVDRVSRVLLLCSSFAAAHFCKFCQFT